ATCFRSASSVITGAYPGGRGRLHMVPVASPPCRVASPTRPAPTSLRVVGSLELRFGTATRHLLELLARSIDQWSPRLLSSVVAGSLLGHLARGLTRRCSGLAYARR